MKASFQQAEAFATGEKLSRDSFEFQMLYGIRRDLQQRLVREGWRVRIYIPFGTEWYPYFMRRLGSGRPTSCLSRAICCGHEASELRCASQSYLTFTATEPRSMRC